MIFFSEARKTTAEISSISKLNPRRLGVSSGLVRPPQIQREEHGQGLQTLAGLEGICRGRGKGSPEAPENSFRSRVPRQGMRIMNSMPA